MSEAVREGQPVWVDLGLDDPEAGRDFYSKLLGWEFEISGPDMGYYSRAVVPDESGRRDDVAGIYTRPDGAAVQWVVYFNTADIDAAVARGQAAGGTSLAEFEVEMVGRVAIMLDPVGAVFGLMQLAGMTPINLQQRYGAVWFEQWSQDAPTARSFYATLFGYEVEPVMLPDLDYALFKAGDLQVGAAGTIPGEAPRWVVYFSTHDVDAACAYNVGAGGSIARPAEDTPYGRMAACVDPFGAEFKLLTPPM